MVEIKGTGEILAKKITVQSGVAAKISTDEGDIAIEPAGGNVNVSGNLNVANGFIYYGDGSGLTNLSGVSPVGSALTSANVWVGDASNLAAARAMSGDATLSNTGVVTLKNTGTSGTYRSVTTDAQGRVSGGTNPTTFAGYGLSDTSANLAAIITDETGTGALVFGTAPAFTGMTNSGAYTQSGTSANTLTGAVTASNAAGVTTPKVKLLAGVELSSTTAANYGGVYSSSHVYVNGDVHALKYYGNGSGLSGVAGDNLGNHTATQDLNLAGNSVLNVDSMSVVGQAGYGGSILTISTGTSTMVEIKGTGEILAKQITVQSGVAAKISSDVGDIAIEPAGGNVNVLGSLNVTSGSNVGLEGASGDTYMKYNSGYISMYVNGLEVARFKP